MVEDLGEGSKSVIFRAIGRVYIFLSVFALEGVKVVIRLNRFASFGIDLALEIRFTVTEGDESSESLESAAGNSRKDDLSEALDSAFNFTLYTLSHGELITAYKSLKFDCVPGKLELANSLKNRSNCPNDNLMSSDFPTIREAN